jgi:ATP-dependent Clp protease adaptor protein ClpS
MQGIEMAQSDTRTRIKPSEAVKEPPMFKVIYLNDNMTPMTFVVETLTQIFNYGEETANKITTDVHETGSAVVAILPYELAEQKVFEVKVKKLGFEYHVVRNLKEFKELL